MRSTELEILLTAQLHRLDEGHLLRLRRAVRHLDATHLEIDGKRYVNFAGNDYLALTHHPRITSAARAAIATHGFGSGAAPLVSGYTDLHAAAEQAIARWKGTEDAVLLPSGFQANYAAVGTLAAAAAAAGRGVRFLLDKLCHASLIDAVRATESPFRVFSHNGIPKLTRLLREADANQLQIVVTESIFSMDGDAADLAALARLKCEYPFVLLLDEAHGSGAYGPAGAGYAAELQLTAAVDLSIVTLSKALGGIGGAVCGSRYLCSAVVNFGRPYLFSTSIPSAACAAAIEAIEVMRDEPQRQERVRRFAREVRETIRSLGLQVPAGDSPIIPILLGDEKIAVDAAMSLRARGLFVIPIRPPTVPRGTSRLRVTLSCEHTDGEVAQLLDALEDMVA